jgi:GH25 family lysozyme M1 (1,4-beta-N-acetylmuramidase)
MADVQKISDHIKHLQKLKKQYGNKPLVYSCDDEGNSFQHVYFSPSPVKFIENNREIEVPTFKEDVNAICIN